MAVGHVLATGPATAQAPARAPSGDLTRTERWFDSRTAEQRRAAGGAALPSPSSTSAAKADRRPLLVLADVTLEGATALPTDVLAGTWRPLVGRTVSQADLVDVTEKITALYRDRGYHLSRAVVPPQDIVGGRIRIAVIEGRISEITLKGDRAEAFGLAALLNVVTTEAPARRETLERQLLLASDIPGVRIADTMLDEIGTATGRFRLTVVAETWRVYAGLSIDNRGTSAVGPLQTYLAGNLNSALVDGDTLGVNLSTTPIDMRELAFGRLFYSLPVGTDGARLTASGSYGAIRPGDDRRLLGTRSWAETLELKGTIVPLRSRRSSLWVTAGAMVMDAAETSAFDLAYRDRLRTLGLTIDYQLHDQLDGWNYVTASVRQGLNVWGASQSGDLFLSRPDGSGEFTKLELAYTRYQPLSDIWSVKLSAFGQWSSTPLLAVQELYLGSVFGRGYFGVDLSGDNGFEVAAELRYDRVLSSEFLKGVQLYGFVDATMLWNIDAFDGRPISLTLAGAGTRFYLPADLQAGVELAVPVQYRVDVEPRPDPRLFFYVAKTFKLCPASVQLRCS